MSSAYLHGIFHHPRAQACAGILALCVACSGCSPFELKDPHSNRYSELTIAVGDGTNGSVQGKDILEVDGIEFTFGVLALADHTLYRHTFLKAGDYTVVLMCHRDWPEPYDPATKPRPYGLNTNHLGESFEIMVEAHKKYVLDCAPGLDRSKFFISEVPIGGAG